MNESRFDQLSKLFAQRESRRNLVAGGLGLTAASLATRTAAQEATPMASPVADDESEGLVFLFVQHFNGGTWVPKEDEDGTYILTLNGASASTVYFSDRPNRIVGLLDNQQFVDALGFTPTNPPNAAVVAHTEEGDQELLVIELYAPSYDAASQTLTYEAHILEDYGEHGLAHLVQQQADFHLPEVLGDGSLFIDDCPGTSAGCYLKSNNQFLGNFTVLKCFDHTTGTCKRCTIAAFDCLGPYPRCDGVNADGDSVNLCFSGAAG